MRFARPEALWLLALVPALAVAYALDLARRRRLLDRLGHAPTLERMTASLSPPRLALRAVCVAVAVGCVALAAARPQVGGRAHLLRKRGIDVVVALDFSKSMLARDVYPSRIERAKRELGMLLGGLAGDRIGLVAFAGETLTYPLTTDQDAARLFFRDLSPADLPLGGTAIGRALGASIDALARVRKGGSSGSQAGQAIVLLTDGEETDGALAPLDQARAAAKRGIRVFTVGIGSPGGDLVPERDDGGQPSYLRRPEGGFVTSRLDEATLKQIAELTGGEYFRLDPKRFGMENVGEALGALEKAELEARVVKRYDEVFEWFLLPALALLVLETCLGDRRRPRRAARARRATA